MALCNYRGIKEALIDHSEDTINCMGGAVSLVFYLIISYNVFQMVINIFHIKYILK